MIRIDDSYCEFYDDTDEKYPAGKAVDVSSEDSFDGTPYLARWMNDIIGFGQALWVKAFGTEKISEISNEPDNIEASDRVTAICKIADDQFKKHLYALECYDAESVFEWDNFGVEYDANKNYFAVGYLPKKLENFLRVDCQAKQDGLHVKILQLVGGAQITYSDFVKWNSFIWGANEVKWGEKARTKVNILLSEVE